MLLDIIRTYTLYSRAVLDDRRLHHQGHPALPAGRSRRCHRRPGHRPIEAAGPRLAPPRLGQDAAHGLRGGQAAPAAAPRCARPSSSSSTGSTSSSRCRPSSPRSACPGLRVAETKERAATAAQRGRPRGHRHDHLPLRRCWPAERARNIVVMVDEAHRTQEGRLGYDMREALPNANLIGLDGHAHLDRRPQHVGHLRRPRRPRGRAEPLLASSGPSPTARRCPSTSRRGSSTSTSTRTGWMRRSPNWPRPRTSTRTSAATSPARPGGSTR